MHSGRKVLGQPLEFGDGSAIDLERVGGGQLLHRQADGILTIELQVGGIGLGAEFGMAHIFQPHQSAVAIGLKNDVVKLRRFAKSAHGTHADLVILAGNGRLLSHLAGGDLHVLLGEGVYHIGSGEASPGHTCRIEPQAHGKFPLTENYDVGDAWNPFERIPDINIEIVAHEQRGISVVVGNNGSAEDEVLRGLLRGNAHGFDRTGQPSLSRVHTILDVDGGEIGIAG